MEAKPGKEVFGLRRIGSVPAKVALVYVLVGCLWILLSDRAISALFQDPLTIARMQTIKGWGFVLVTGLILYILLRNIFSKLGHSEDALRYAENKFRTLVEQALVGIYIIREGRFIYVNPGFQEIFGYTMDEILAMPSILELVAESDRHIVADNVRMRLAGAVQSLHYSFTGRKKDGARIDVEVHGSAIDFEGKKAIIGVLLDITERRRAEAALRDSEERTRLLIDSAEDIIVMHDTEGTYLYYNGSARYGLTAEEVVGKKPRDIFDEAVAEKIMDQIRTVAASGEGLSDEREVLWRGEHMWFLDQVSPVKDAQGKVTAVVRISRNITDRKKAERTIGESEERYRVIAETASDAIITVDEDSRVVFANRAVLDIFGYEPEDLKGKLMTVIVPPRFRDGHMQGMRRYLDSGVKKAGWRARELPGLHRDGYEIPLEISYGEFEKDGRRYFTGVIRDITERKVAEKEKQYSDMLERFSQQMQSLIAERTISLLALRLADRVRNPAAVIGWTGKRLLKQAEVPQAWKEHMSTIIEEVENLEGIVKEFQSLLTHKDPVYAYNDLNGVVRGVLSVIGKEADRRHIRLEESLFAGALTMNMQKETMRMAIFIIMRNAVESSPEGGAVTVMTSEEDDKVMLSVADSGAGIPKRMQERLFDPFYSARMERYGIGWPLVKQIVYEHMGTVEIESEKGAGSLFTVIFPKRWIDSTVGVPGGEGGVKGI